MLQKIDEISPLSDSVISFIYSLALNQNVKKIIVFGSRSLGDYEQYSDLDLAVDAPDMSRFEWLKIKEFAVYDLRSLIRVSLVHYSSNPEKLKERINKTGVVIYERQTQSIG